MNDETRDFTALIRSYLEQSWKRQPVSATISGVHEYDHEMPAVSRDALEGEEREDTSLLRALEAQDESQLSDADRVDYQLLMGLVKSRLQQRELRLWERAPYQYPELAGRSLHSLLERDYAPLSQRGAAMVSRLKAIPQLLEDGAGNLTPQMPPLWVDIAQASCQGLEKFLVGAVPEVSRAVPQLDQELERASQGALEAVGAFREKLHSLADRARGDYGVGTDYFDRLLKEHYRLDLDSHELLEYGEACIAASLEKLEETAARIDASRPWWEVMEMLKENHCPADELLDAYEEEVEACRRFVQEHDLVTIPPGETCHMAPTPVFLLSRYPMGHFSGVRPFEAANQGLWFMTPVDPDAPAAIQKQHLRDNNYHFMRAITLHECYPGHHLQRFYQKLHPSDLRKVASDTMYTEGWGLYTEELMYEAGFLSDPRDRLVQLRNELWRGVRIVIDTGLHCRGMGFDEATELLMDKVRFERLWAEGEIRRYTTSPTQPSTYLVGRRLLLKLREDYRRQQGSNFTLRDFHDRLLSLGAVPIAIARQELLGDTAFRASLD